MKFVRVFSAILACVPSLACSSSDGGSAQGGAAGAAPIAFGGASSSSGGASNTALGGKTAGLGGKTAGLAGENSITGGASAGSPSTSGGASSGGATSSSSAGGALAGGAGGGPTNPGPGADGLSPYKQECHGDSLSCGNPALRCLGLRDGSGVLGYSCSNVCDTVNDCNAASSGTDATPGCLDFVNERHCLLVCQDDTGQKTCPQGMSCYVYPGTTLGYCLWR